MAVKGFNIGGSINRYDFNSLVNKEGAVTADMLGSDVTTQLTTMSSNISTLQSQVATLNDGYTQLSSGKADNGVPLKGGFYMTYKYTSGSGSTVTFTNTENRYTGILFTEQNGGYSAIFLVRYKAPNKAEMTRIFGATESAYQAIVETNGNMKIYLDSWSKATFIGTQMLS